MRKYIFIFLIVLGLYSQLFANAGIDNANKLFEKYGWTSTFVSSQTVTLPRKFVHSLDQYPLDLYFGLANIVSKKCGLKLSKYRGKTVDFLVFDIVENLPNSCLPFTVGKGISVVSNNKVVGAWIYSFNCFLSIDRKHVVFKDIDNREWATGLVKNKLVKKRNKTDKELSKLSSEEIIRRMFNALNEKRYIDALACFTRRYALNFSVYNFEVDGKLEDRIYRFFVGNLDMIKSVEIIDMKKLDTEQSDLEVFDVTTKIVYNNNEIQNRRWIIIMKEEIPKLGFRIADIQK